MSEKKLQRAVVVLVFSKDFAKVRELLENADIEFAVTDPLLGISKISGVNALKE